MSMAITCSRDRSATCARSRRCPSCASASEPRWRRAACPTASASASARSASPSTPPATCWARPRCPWRPEAGVRMLPTAHVGETTRGRSFAGELILAPPAAGGSTWMRRFGPHETAFASGWMRVRGTRRRKGFDRGFVLSDHADWPGLLRTIEETGARRVLVTHGYADELSRYLRERGYDSAALPTPFRGEADLES